jgi:transketolase
VIIIDRNTLQITGRTEEVMGLEPLAEKFTAFGCAVRTCNGNSIEDLIRIFDGLPFEQHHPNLIYANTTKGKGISFIEDAVQWHHKVPSDEEFSAAMTELNTAEAAL